MLKIENLKVAVGSTEILKGLNLTVNKGEVHAIMGPNGSGKSTLSHVIAGKEGYDVTGGDITFRNESIVDKLPEEIGVVFADVFRRTVANVVVCAGLFEFVEQCRQLLQVIGVCQLPYKISRAHQARKVAVLMGVAEVWHGEARVFDVASNHLGAQHRVFLEAVEHEHFAALDVVRRQERTGGTSR